MLLYFPTVYHRINKHENPVLAFTILTGKGKLSFYFSCLDSSSISPLSFIVLEHGTEIMHFFASVDEMAISVLFQ